ncbi:MAG: hypothetical protein ABWY03_02435 [Microbacterium sp.]
MSTANSRRLSDESGIGIVEIVVATFILGLIAIALLPMLITGMRVAVDQSTVATATRLLNDSIEEARAVALDPTIACTAVELENTATDGRGVELEVVGTVVSNTHAGVAVGSNPPPIVKASGCSDFAAPGSLTVRFTVTRTDTAAELARATTIISVLTPPEEAP